MLYTMNPDKEKSFSFRDIEDFIVLQFQKDLREIHLFSFFLF